MDKINCDICGKPCGSYKGLQEGAKVYHLECAYDSMEERRNKIRDNVPPKLNESSPHDSLPTRVSE